MLFRSVVWSDIAKAPRATVLAPGDRTVPLNSCYTLLAASIPDALAFAALLNAAPVGAWLATIAEPARGGYRRYLAWTIARLPVPADWPRARAILAPIAARLVQLAVSRQREYLADASSVELTRNPYGLERALAVIARDTEPLEVANRATQHLYFANPIKKLGDPSRLFSTHPPIVDRINRLRALTGEQPLGGPDALALAERD